MRSKLGRLSVSPGGSRDCADADPSGGGRRVARASGRLRPVPRLASGPPCLPAVTTRAGGRIATVPTVFRPRRRSRRGCGPQRDGCRGCGARDTTGPRARRVDRPSATIRTSSLNRYTASQPVSRPGQRRTAHAGDRAVPQHLPSERTTRPGGAVGAHVEDVPYQGQPGDAAAHMVGCGDDGLAHRIDTPVDS